MIAVKQEKSPSMRINRVRFRQLSSSSSSYEYIHLNQSGLEKGQWKPANNMEKFVEGKSNAIVEAARQVMLQHHLTARQLVDLDLENSFFVVKSLHQALEKPLNLKFKLGASLNSVDHLGDLKPRLMQILRSRSADLGKSVSVSLNINSLTSN